MGSAVEGIVNLLNTLTFTVFTPTFNRESSLHRVFDSLQSQTFRDFEWIIIDDGSTDNTKSVVETFQKACSFPIIYKYQNNSGKHVAMNRAVSLAHGKFFVIADSDDAFVPESLEFFVRAWREIPSNQNKSYKGITCRCQEESGAIVGSKPIPAPWIDLPEPEAKYAYGYRYELWGMTRTDILRQFPFPEPRGLHFFPESVIWDSIGEHYLTRYFDMPLRIFYHDQDNSTTKKGNSRYQENYYLWLHIINNLKQYKKYQPVMYLKAIIGIARDGLSSGRTIHIIRNDIHGPIERISFLLTMPIGYFLYRRQIRNKHHWHGENHD